jgi:hypothetical protein
MMLTVSESNDQMRLAFQAMLTGDTAARDHHVELARRAIERERDEGLARLLSIDFFVTPHGTVIPTVKMMARA